MRIKTTLWLSTAVAAILAALVGVMLLATFVSMQALIARFRHADGIERSVFELNILTLDVQGKGLERAREQWHAKYEALHDALADLTNGTGEPSAIGKLMLANLETLPTTIDVLRKQVNGSPHDDGGMVAATRNRLLARTGTVMLGLMADARRMREGTYADLAAWQRMAVVVMTLTVLACFGLIVGMKSLLNRMVIRPLIGLERAAAIIGDGNLDHRTRMATANEIGSLSRAFDTMLDRLNGVMASIRNINQQLQKANAEKDKLFAIIAHDLKSPMAGLVVSTEMLAREPEIISEKDFGLLATALHKNARNTFDLLEDLLQWARMSQEGMDFEPTQTSLNDLLHMGLSTANDLANRKGIAISSDIPQGLIVLADQPMIKTVIRNILFNAIKFTPRQGEIVITARQEEQKVTVAVQDNGIGMKEQVLSSIFSLEKEKRQLGTEGEKGTGLGLMLCKQFIEQHGGEIWVESEPGKGTTVFFTLPTKEIGTP